MRLAEYDGKVLLRRHGVAVPRGELVYAGENPSDAAADWPGYVLKAQLLEGGRGKRGLVRGFERLADFRDARRLILPALEDANIPLLLEEAVPIAREIFVAVRVDGSAQRLELLIAPEGGENVEATAKLARIPIEPGAPTTPEKIFAALGKLFPPDLTARLARYAARLPDIARQEDLTLLEINPLALTKDGGLVACDAKIVRDEAADFRHDSREFAISRMLAERAMTNLERQAQALGFQLVETDGDVVLVTSGAGLGMMMMDLIADHGMRAASFMDNLRGAPDETMSERLKVARALAARPNIKAIIFQTTLASRSLAERIEALTAWLAAEPLPKPLFVGIAAGHAAARKMSAEEAVERLGAVGVSAFTDPVALVKAAAQATGSSAPADQPAGMSAV
jgi:succinyl-CoA synthetase beta subunit